jgi:hypothetical protein
MFVDENNATQKKKEMHPGAHSRDNTFVSNKVCMGRDHSCQHSLPKSWS